ncbi:MAG: hypothetical protein WC994_04100 [Brumimicrobium sp.]
MMPTHGLSQEVEVGQLPITTTMVTNSLLKMRGYVSILEMYGEINPSIYEPPYMRPVRSVV